MGTSNARYSLECRCGKHVSVSADDAGTPVTCECGAPVSVPSLSKLRTLAGADPYEAGPIDTINRMIGRGELPGPVCLLSGRPTEAVLDLHVRVATEFSDVNPDQAKWRTGRITLISMILGVWNDATRELIPYEESIRTVATPVRLEKRHHAKYHRGNQTLLKQLLAREPMYSKLIKDFPWSEVRLGRMESA